MSEAFSRSKHKQHVNANFLGRVMKGVAGHNNALASSSSDTRGTTKRNQLSPHRSERPKKEKSFSPPTGKMHGWSEEEGLSDNCNTQRRSSREGHSRSHRRRHAENRESEDYTREKRTSDEDGRRKRRETSERRHHHRSKKRRSLSPAGTSKMDKYFAKNYDPRLDVRAEIHCSETGLVEDDGWDNMLSVLRQREQDREQRSTSRNGPKSQASQTSSSKYDLFATQYTQSGTAREWDKGKVLD